MVIDTHGKKAVSQYLVAYKTADYIQNTEINKPNLEMIHAELSELTW